MKLAEAASLFLEDSTKHDFSVDSKVHPSVSDQALSLLATYFSTDALLSDITPSGLRDFLSRWCVERTWASNPNDVDSSAQLAGIQQPQNLLDSLAEFFKWADDRDGADRATQYAPLLFELGVSLPRALAITRALSGSLRECGGAFDFPEFLTSFEGGGGSQYDIDVPGNVGAIDGYFRIVRVDGSSVEAEELVSEERVRPIVFPKEVADLLDVGYILSLELVRTQEGWRIAGCGFAYPPGAQI